ncbi:glycosyltransferase family 2 protein [Leptothrix sp. BB-4]
MTPDLLLATLFWGAWLLVVYAHGLYPILLLLLTRGRVAAMPKSRPDLSTDDLEAPRVACIVAAYNEERHVAARVRNLLTQQYPADRLRVHIGSDGSSDRTAELLGAIDDPRVDAAVFSVNRGKASVLNDLVARAADADILVLSDANTLFEPDVVARLVSHFRDPTVGAVCGELRLLDARGSNQDSVYWRVEQALKRSEASIGGLLGANGAIYAIRRELYEPLAADTIVDDFCVAMAVVARGHRLVYDADAVALEDTPDDIADEYRRRVRIGIGNYQAFFRHPEYLTRTNAATRLTYVSHKVLRWFTPQLLGVALLASLVLGLLGSTFYGALALAQAALYGGVTLWQRLPSPPRLPKLVNLVVFFLALNGAFLVAFWRYLTGQYSGSWRRTERG